MNADPPQPAEPEAEVVDLHSHRKAAAAKAAAAKALARKNARIRSMASGQSLLGGRRHAGLILVAVGLLLIGLLLFPRFL